MQNIKSLVDDIHSLTDIEALKYRLDYYNEQYKKYTMLVFETELRIKELEGDKS